MGGTHTRAVGADGPSPAAWMPRGTCDAPMRPALKSLQCAIANWPPGSQPKMVTISPPFTEASLAPKESGGEDIGEQDSLVVGDAVGQDHRTHLGVGDARVFGLQAPKGTRALPSEKGGTGQGAVWVRVVALGVIAGPAIGTVAAAYGRRDHDALALAQIAHMGPVSSTMPTLSWPGMVPGSLSLRVPRTMCGSVPQMALFVSFMMAWSGFSRRGSGARSRRMPPIPWKNDGFHRRSFR